MRILKTGIAAIALMTAAIPAISQADGEPPSMIHGFGSVQFSTDYITPRGLVVSDKGVTLQALAGLVWVLPKNFSIVAGSWNDADLFHQHAPGVGAWVEEDFFAGVNYQLSKKTKLSITYDSWNFPGGAPSNEQNIEFTGSYDDSAPARSWSLQPHATVFWAIASPSSTVVLGQPADKGTTAYLELGATPTLALKSIPLTITAPTWISVGAPKYWCADSSTCGSNHFGVLSTGLTFTTPASFIPPQYGHWRLYAGFQYFNLLNGALVDSQEIVVGSTHRNVINGFIGTGFGF